ncbi:hypothetical protein DZC31_17625 [Stenotrophomonas rhizophila]|nr:hypothetical protein DZC31_17625 [Stenotrophomonas rhizophila]
MRRAVREGRRRIVFPVRASGAALQPFRDTRPLLQESALVCRSGLVSRKGCAAAPESYMQRRFKDERCGAMKITC